MTAIWPPPQGPTGPLGPTGPAGPTGAGSPGPTGPTGAAGGVQIGGDLAGTTDTPTVKKLSSSSTRFGVGGSLNSFASGSSTMRSNYDITLNSGSGGLVDTSKESWSIVAGDNADHFAVYRAPPTAGVPVYSLVFVVSNAGLANFPSLQANGQNVATLDSAGHVPEGQSPVRTGTAVITAVGHSYTRASAGVPRQPDGYLVRFANALGAKRVNNMAVDSACACSPEGISGAGGFGWVLQNVLRPGSPGHPDSAAAPYLPRDHIAIPHYGLNDLGRLGSTNPRPFTEAMRTILSRFCAGAVIEDDDSHFAYTGSWSDFAATTFNSGSQVKFSSTLNDKVVFTVPSDMPANRAVALICSCFWSQDHTIGVKVNGSAKADARLQGSVLCDPSSSGRHLAIALRFRPTAWGASNSPFDYAVNLNPGDTIELSLKTQTIGASSLNVDCAHIEADPLDGPVLLLPGLNRPPSYTGWSTYPKGPSDGTDPMNDAAIATFNTALQSIGPEFPNRAFVDIDTSLAKASVNYFTDNTHPNLQGHGLIAQSLRDAVVASGLLTSRSLGKPVPGSAPYFMQVGGATGTAFQNSWSSFGSIWDAVGYRRELDGRVTIRGPASHPTNPSINTVIYTLPAGYRPSKVVDRPTMLWDGAAWAFDAVLRIAPDGTVRVLGIDDAAGTGSFYYIDATFMAGQ